jgi:hypothetical protein
MTKEDKIVIVLCVVIALIAICLNWLNVQEIDRLRAIVLQGR